MEVDDQRYFNVDSMLMCLLGTYSEYFIQPFNLMSEWNLIRTLARKENNSAFCMNWEIKCSWGVWAKCEPLSGFSGELWVKAVVKFTKFNLKLV